MKKINIGNTHTFTDESGTSEILIRSGPGESIKLYSDTGIVLDGPLNLTVGTALDPAIYKPVLIPAAGSDPLKVHSDAIVLTTAGNNSTIVLGNNSSIKTVQLIGTSKVIITGPLECSSSILGTSLSVGSGTIGGGAITGTSLGLGSGTITSGEINASGNINSLTGNLTTLNGSVSSLGVVTGTSLVLGNGAVGCGAVTSTGAISGTSLSVGSGAISGGTITGTSLSVGTGDVTGGAGSFTSLSTSGGLSGSGNISLTSGNIVTSSGALTCSGTMTCNNASIGGTTTSTGIMYANATTASTSTSTGSIICAGGIGVSGKIFCNNPYGSVVAGTAQSISSGVDTELSTYWSGTSEVVGDITFSSGRFTVANAGKYLVTYNIVCSLSGTKNMYSWVAINGAATRYNFQYNPSEGFATGSFIIKLAANDYVSLKVVTGSNGTMDKDNNEMFLIYKLP